MQSQRQAATRRKVSDMNIKNKLWRAAGIAATAAAIGALGLTGVASASTAQPAAGTSVSHHAGPATAAAALTAENPCYATASTASLIVGGTFTNALGPLLPPSGVCHDLNINLTSAPDGTTAQACLEPSGGGALQCGPWISLIPNKWLVLYPNVRGGTRWQIKMNSQGLGTAVFSYTV